VQLTATFSTCLFRCAIPAIRPDTSVRAIRQTIILLNALFNKEQAMKFVEKQCADATLDLVCRMCPLHLLEPGEKLRCLKRVQVLEVLTDPVKKEVIEAMAPYFDRLFGNPSAVYDLGSRCKQALALAIANYEKKVLGVPKPEGMDIEMEKSGSEIVCPHCLAVNPAAANFCMGCGEKIER
jgi:TusA-related sulfurtransferase/ribosomal protein L40E